MQNCICYSAIKCCPHATGVPHWGFDLIEKVPEGFPERVILN